MGRRAEGGVQSSKYFVVWVGRRVEGEFENAGNSYNLQLQSFALLSFSFPKTSALLQHSRTFVLSSLK